MLDQVAYEQSWQAYTLTSLVICSYRTSRYLDVSSQPALLLCPFFTSWKVAIVWKLTCLQQTKGRCFHYMFLNCHRNPGSPVASVLAEFGSHFAVAVPCWQRVGGWPGSTLATEWPHRPRDGTGHSAHGPARAAGPGRGAVGWPGGAGALGTPHLMVAPS